MDHRRAWNRRQPGLRRMLLVLEDHKEAMRLFRSQHAQLHSASLAPKEPWSFEDEIASDLSEEGWRRIPSGQDHSRAWILWHVARTEDVTMNLLLAGSPQILDREEWLGAMQIDVAHMGTSMTANEVAQLSQQIDLTALRAYRLRVGKNNTYSHLNAAWRLKARRQ